jgi:hypothetical protein
MSAGLLFAATLLIASVGLIVFHHG